MIFTFAHEGSKTGSNDMESKELIDFVLPWIRPMTSRVPRRTESQKPHLINREPLAGAISVSDITLMARRRRLHTW